jgi:hypothetical protein
LQTCDGSFFLSFRQDCHQHHQNDCGIFVHVLLFLLRNHVFKPVS